MRESTGGTRERIQAVALELFTEQGYEKTSLREIAERLNVTKAALYYHFKSKDEIVTSFVNDRLERIDEIVAWAESQPPTRETRRALIAQYADTMFAGDHPSVMRFFEQNQTVLKSLAAGQQMRGRMMRLASELCRGDDSPGAQLRAALSLFAVHTSWFAVRTPDITDADRRKLALEVADELLARIGQPADQAAAGSAAVDDGTAVNSAATDDDAATNSGPAARG